MFAQLMDHLPMHTFRRCVARFKGDHNVKSFTCQDQLRRPLKRALRTLRKIADTHKGKRQRLYFQDEARIGQKGRVCHIWWKRGERPPGLLDQRYVNAYIYAAIEPGTDNAFALILPDANRVAMQAFLDAFAETIANGEHVALVLDGAGWHSSKALRVPASITWCRCRPTRPSSIRSSASGCI